MYAAQRMRSTTGTSTEYDHAPVVRRTTAPTPPPPTPNHHDHQDVICRTAVDALQAKYSAVIYAGYTPHRNRHSVPSTPPPQPHPKHHVPTSTNTTTTTSSTLPPVAPTTGTTIRTTATRYDQLLQCMTEYFIPSPQRQIPLINAGYGIRVATVLHQIETYVTALLLHHLENSNGPILKNNSHPTIDDDDNNNNNNQNINPPPSSTEIQIIILGCGLDVTGLWSLSLILPDQAFPNDTSSNKIGIHVVEIDFPSICQSKIQAMESLQLLDPVMNTTNDETTSTMKSWHGTSKQNPKARYTILSADLQDPSLLDELCTKTRHSGGIIDPYQPTLVLSELVVTYLPHNSCNYLLEKIANVFQHSGSCMVLYEPLGPTSNTSIDDTKGSAPKQVSILPISESYKISYCNRFDAKLQRGVTASPATKAATIGNGRIEPSKRFHPLGISAVGVRERLKRLGYEYVNVATAGTVASYLQQQYTTNHDDHNENGDHHDNRWKATELFDEHAALTLHLSSYVLVTAFPNVSNTNPDSTNDGMMMTVDPDLFRQYLCPWLVATTMGLVVSPQPIGRLCIEDKDTSTTNSCLWITTIRKQDERQVRDLFQQTYQHLFDEYPSIRRMVKSALRKDLGVGSGNPSVTTMDISSIGFSYLQQGGDFIVAIRPNLSYTQQKNDRRQVLGGIGIRQCTSEECVSRSIPCTNDAFCYEIHRFFVDDDFRRYGIGTTLLQKVTLALIQKQKRLLQQQRRRQQRIEDIHRTNISHSSHTLLPPPPPPLLYLTATTPTILHHANQFYNKHGFVLHSTIVMGELNMNTYIKAIYIT